MTAIAHRLAAGVATALAVAAVGCGAESVPPELAVIDHTGSSASGSPALCAEELLSYARGRYGPVDGKRGTLRVGVFDASTAANPTFPVEVAFTVPAKDQSSPRKTQERLDAQLSRLDDAVTRLLASSGRPRGGTDVVTMLASLGDAARAAGAERIWMCTDMVDNRLPNPLTPGGATAVVRELEQTDALPDLRGISVIVDTSTIRGRTGVTAAEVSALRTFTEQLVTKAGGRLLAYGPSASDGAAA